MTGRVEEPKPTSVRVNALIGTTLSVFARVTGAGAGYISPGADDPNRRQLECGYFHMRGIVKGVATESNGAAVELWVAVLNLRFSLPIAEHDGEHDLSAEAAPVTRYGLEAAEEVSLADIGQSPVPGSSSLQEAPGRPKREWAQLVAMPAECGRLESLYELRQLLARQRRECGDFWSSVAARSPSAAPAAAAAPCGVPPQRPAGAKAAEQEPDTTRWMAAANLSGGADAQDRILGAPRSAAGERPAPASNAAWDGPEDAGPATAGEATAPPPPAPPPPLPTASEALGPTATQGEWPPSLPGGAFAPAVPGETASTETPSTAARSSAGLAAVPVDRRCTARRRRLDCRSERCRSAR